MHDLDQIIETAKILWPIAMWAAWVNHSVKQNRKDIDNLYFMMRGNKGKRCSSIAGRIKRLFFKLSKGKPDGTNDRQHGRENPPQADHRAISESGGGLGPEGTLKKF